MSYASPLPPEFFALLGIGVFTVISLLICLLDKHFPRWAPFIYQAAALAGFSYLLISKSLASMFGEYMRFYCSFIYLIVALANVAAVNIHMAISRKLWSLAKIFFGSITFPAIIISTFSVSIYANWMMPLFLFQPGPIGFLFATLASCIVVLAICIFSSFKLTRTKNARAKIKREVK
jgi:hypothetical protein